MHSRLTFFLAALLISAGASDAMSKSDLAAQRFTVQVASFPDASQAARFAAELGRVGEAPVFDTVEIEGRGCWTRVYVGLFETADAARRYGVALVARGIIREFLVRKADSNLALTRPRKIATDSGLGAQPKAAASEKTTSGPTGMDRSSSGGRAAQHANNLRGVPQRFPRDQVSTPLPVVRAAALRLAPIVDTNLIPRPDPVDLAFRLVVLDQRDSSGAARPPGGVWLGGDAAEGLARLRWIVGDANMNLITLEADGRVRLDRRLLSKAAGLREARVEDPLRAADYISSNEGLLLLVQATQGRYRYLLHIGRQAPTFGKSVETAGSINLDNNADSRINPYRKDGKKLDGERPPEGFDSLIALNPVARWFNLSANCWVQTGEIVFHELAEAYAKLALGLDYLDHGSRQGAHANALARELRLKSQRPGADIIITTGSNRLLRTEEEIRLFYAGAGVGSNQR